MPGVMARSILTEMAWCGYDSCRAVQPMCLRCHPARFSLRWFNQYETAFRGLAGTHPRC